MIQNFPFPSRQRDPRGSDPDSSEIGWDSGAFADGRPYLAECWADGGMTVVTFFFARAGLEDYSEENLAELLETESLVRWTQAARRVSAKPFVDDQGTHLLSASVVIGIGHDRFVDDFLSLKPYPRQDNGGSDPPSVDNDHVGEGPTTTSSEPGGQDLKGSGDARRPEDRGRVENAAANASEPEEIVSEGYVDWEAIELRHARNGLRRLAAKQRRLGIVHPPPESPPRLRVHPPFVAARPSVHGKHLFRVMGDGAGHWVEVWDPFTGQWDETRVGGPSADLYAVMDAPRASPEVLRSFNVPA